jgi:5-methylcytosine-specific restriction endonuclease McrA
MKGKRHSEEAKDKMSLAQAKSRNLNIENWIRKERTLYDAIRNSYRNKEWRIAVYEKDNYECQHCGDAKGGNLNSHHLYPFAEILIDFGIETFEDALECGQLWDVNNGLTLCEDCHTIEHKKDNVKRRVNLKKADKPT